MLPYLDIAVTEPSQVGEARRAAARLAAAFEFDETTAGRVALVVTELGTNLVRHAQRGRLLVGARREGDGVRFEVLSIDHGPGMTDVARCLRDGYSSGGTPGNGLGAVRRLSTEFSLHSEPAKGTVLLSRIRTGTAGPGAPCAWAGIALAAPGEVVSGDAWDLRLVDGRAMLIVADGLGHGPVAAEAADRAVALFREMSGTPAALLQRAHEPMRQTRGAAVSIASLDAAAGSITFAGAGNVSGRIVSGVEDRSLLSQHGTLGVQVRRPQDLAYAWPPHAVVVLHSDGLTSRWNLRDSGALLQADPAVIAAWLLRDHTRGHDDVTVVVVRRSAA